MSKKQSFFLHYKVEAEELVTVISLAWEIISETGMNPENITLPDGRVIPWNEYAAHQFAAEGHITESEFIEMSLGK